MLFYQLSDIHFVDGSPRKAHAKNNQRFKSIRNWLLRRAKATKRTPPLLLTGDVVDTPSQDSFDMARRLLSPLKALGYPMYFVPGNHDLSPLGVSWDATGVYQRRWNRFVEEFGDSSEYPTEHVCGDVVFFGVDSASQPTTFARGEVTAEQLLKLRARLDYYRNLGKTLVVHTHHHPFYREFTLAMIDYGAFMQVVYSRCDVLVFGHKHHYAVWDSPEKVSAIGSMPLSIVKHFKENSPECRMKLMVSSGRCTSLSGGFLRLLGYQAVGDRVNLVPINIQHGGGGL